MTERGPEASGLLVETADYMIERGFYGLVWLDDDLTVKERRGRLVEFVPIGEPVGLAILQLYGLDPEFQALREGRRQNIELTNVAMVQQDGPGKRLNFYVHWMQEKQRFLIIVARTTNQDELEAELENQSRRTALAEAKLVENARQIARTNEELTRANRQLSEFAYVISHDLKAPMRAMRYQVEDIETAVAAADASAIAILAAGLKRQERRMSAMLTDLLAYARIGRDDEAIVPTDTRALVTAIVDTLPRRLGIAITIAGDWPVADLAAPALDLVLRNLIDNAVKHHDRDHGRIEVTAHAAGPWIEIAVTDDGPGIDTRYHSAVFQPFRKVPLDGRSDADGSGIGLALVRKTAETAGARLTLVSDPQLQRGTTFHLAWPVPAGQPPQQAPLHVHGG